MEFSGRPPSAKEKTAKESMFAGAETFEMGAARG
jgi:hypothetical protein